MIIEYKDYRISSDESLNLFYAITACLKEKASCLHFEKGIYHFNSEFAFERALCIANHGENGYKRTAFLLEYMSDFEIDGGGSHFIFDSVMNMMTVLNCDNITIKDLTLSMSVCPYPEGRVTAVNDNSFDVEFSYHEELLVEENALLIPIGDKYEPVVCDIEFDGKTHEIEIGTGDNSAGIPLYKLKKEIIAYNTIRFYNSPRIPKLGNTLVLMIGRRYASGLLFDGCNHIKLKNINIYSCVGIGVMAQYCNNFTIQNCSVTSQEGKFISTGADATHFVSCTGNITVSDCLFEHMLDDALNVHGIYVKVHRSECGKAIVKFCNSATTGVDIFKSGDKVCQMDSKTLIPIMSATISSVHKINNEMTELIFEENVEMTEGYIIENLTTYPTLNLRQCTIRNNRARGVLIATKQHCVIEDCDFHTAGSAIVLECDASFWYESGGVMDIEILNNRFEGCKYGAWGNGIIYVPPRELVLPNKYYHGCVVVKGNEFLSCYDDVMIADNVSELIYEQNFSNQEQVLRLSHVGKTDIQPDVQSVICD